MIYVKIQYGGCRHLDFEFILPVLYFPGRLDEFKQCIKFNEDRLIFGAVIAIYVTFQMAAAAILVFSSFPSGLQDFGVRSNLTCPESFIKVGSSVQKLCHY